MPIEVSPEDVRRAREWRERELPGTDEMLKRQCPKPWQMENVNRLMAAYSAVETERLIKELDKAETWLAELDFDFGGVRSAFANVVNQIDCGNIAGARQQAQNWRTGFPNTRKAAAEAERDRLRKALATFGFHHQYCDRKVRGPHYPCNCGFEAALQGGSAGGER